MVEFAGIYATSQRKWPTVGTALGCKKPDGRKKGQVGARRVKFDSLAEREG